MDILGSDQGVVGLVDVDVGDHDGVGLELGLERHVGSEVAHEAQDYDDVHDAETARHPQQVVAAQVRNSGEGQRIRVIVQVVPQEQVDWQYD